MLPGNLHKLNRKSLQMDDKKILCCLMQIYSRL